MFNKVLGLGLFFCVFLFPFNLSANVTDLHLKLPFPAGETWHTSCAYNGTYENNCATHGAWTTDRYALDFNYGSGNDDFNKSILAVASGRAEIHPRSKHGYGNFVFLKHDGGYITRYAHLNSISVKDGEWIEQGQEIGKCGNTGHSSSTHLHFALYHRNANGTLVATKPEPIDGYTDLHAMHKSYTSHNVARGICHNNNTGERICVTANHTHVVHSDFRCSKKYPNGDFLCWEPGGETNCWDANFWYKIPRNVNSDNVYSLRLSGNYSYNNRGICAEVYSAGNNSNGSGGGSGGEYLDPEDFCHETTNSASNGGWGWNPVTQQGCLLDDNEENFSSNNFPDDSENYCHETAETATNGGWGWNPVTQEGCLVEESGTDDYSGNTPDTEDYCHETSDTATNGGWGWNPVTQQGCLVDGSN